MQVQGTQVQVLMGKTFESANLLKKVQAEISQKAQLASQCY
jgi:hypothetical protein